jgi:hypothetical protein
MDYDWSIATIGKGGCKINAELRWLGIECFREKSYVANNNFQIITGSDEVEVRRSHRHQEREPRNR